LVIRHSLNIDSLTSIAFAAFLLSLMLVALPMHALATDTPTATALDIEIDMVDVNNLYVVDFLLHYNTECLDLVEAIPIPPWSTNLIIKNEINDEEGAYRLVMVGLAPAPPFDGSATLATLKFLATDGEPNFLLSVNALGDPKGRHIAYAIDGLIIKGILTHDVAITEIRGRPRGTYQGGTLKVYVEAENQGNFVETFNVTLYADQDKTTVGDELIIGTQTVHDLAAKEATFLTFVWDTTGVNYGIYWLSAEASQVQEETDVADNFLKAGEYIGGIYPPPHVRQRADLLTQITSVLMTISVGAACIFQVKRYWFP